MFDQHASELLAAIPSLATLDPAQCRRLLSTSYNYVMMTRLGFVRTATDDADVRATCATLRRLVDALENSAVFDPLAGIEVPRRTIEASAFVAAEALALTIDLTGTRHETRPSVDALDRPDEYVRIEAALLYMIAGYDVNAVALIRPLSNADLHTPDTTQMLTSIALRARILDLCMGRVRSGTRPPLPSLAAELSILYEDILADILSRCFRELAQALDRYFNWLGGIDAAGHAEAVRAVNHVRSVAETKVEPRITELSRVYHLAALLGAAIDATSRRSLANALPPPSGIDPESASCFTRYVAERAGGTSNTAGRPFLWPSTLEYVAACLPGPQSDAVVTMPTGSGKSFLAEIAIAQALCRGWVLYLAPTNALAEQIRRDLTRSLGAFRDLEAPTFVGGAEYNDLSEDRLSKPGRRLIAVMTPEKCALLLRLSPATFSDCTLCVFDECHVLGDRHRGFSADIVLAQLFRIASSARILLMSAMVSNADEIAAWIGHVRGTKAKVPLVKWRPSRTVRGFVVVDKDAFEKAKAEAQRTLSSLPPKRRHLDFQVPLAWIVGLSGPWSDDGPDDYRTTSLPLEATATLSRNAKGKVTCKFQSWKNSVGRLLAERFAERKIPVINFLLASKLHPFTQAARARFEVSPVSLPSEVSALLGIAKLELGVDSVLAEYLQRGVSVHTSAMLAAERQASEVMFGSAYVPLMFATGTLAQGLNLPAIAVIVSGSSVGDPREVDDAAENRAEEIILNGFGRAGRPGFANHGIVFLVSDTPFLGRITGRVDPRHILGEYPVLGKRDAAVVVQSPIAGFLDQVSAGGTSLNSALDLELTAILAGQTDEKETPWTVLRRTFAAFQRLDQMNAERAALVDAHVASVKAELLGRAGFPNWMPRAAMKAGVPLRRAALMWRAYQGISKTIIDRTDRLTVDQWVHVLMEVLAHLPPPAILQYRETAARPTPMSRLETMSQQFPADLDIDSIWDPGKEWLEAWAALESATLAYLRGNDYVEIARQLYGKPTLAVDRNRSSGVLPHVVGFIERVVDFSLAIDAGCLLALLECHWEETGSGSAIPETLRSLSMCIRNGCSDIGVLAWHRFGIRYRVCAHALAKRFPVPVDLPDDGARARWVRTTREEWLKESAEGDNLPALQLARELISARSQ